MPHRLTLCENLIRCLRCGSVFVSVEEGRARECPRPPEVRERIERELASAMDRLRQLGGAVVIEEFPGAVDNDGPLADPADRGKINEDREVILATRSLLVERANRLAEALERLRKSQYGICEECGEVIAPARLQAMPEVTTCVRCQGRRERTATQGRVTASS
mgnify:CR=1 FL=1